MMNGQRLSISTGALDRLEMLERSLPTWFAAPEPDEIVVVDWNNAVPLRESLSKFTDPRLVIVRVTDQPHWLAAKCHNLELQASSGGVLLRLDSDTLMGTSFFARHSLEPGNFHAGDWRKAADLNEGGLTGTLYAYKSDLLAVNGYNERLVYYGYDDDDIFERLAAHGLHRHDVDFSTLEHIPHGHRKRFEHLKVASDLPQLKKTEHYQALESWCRINQPENQTIEGQQDRAYLGELSRNLGHQKPWTSRDRMTTWRITPLSARDYECVEVASDGPTSFNNDVSFVEPVAGARSAVRPNLYAKIANTSNAGKASNAGRANNEGKTSKAQSKPPQDKRRPNGAAVVKQLPNNHFPAHQGFGLGIPKNVFR